MKNKTPHQFANSYTNKITKSEPRNKKSTNTTVNKTFKTSEYSQKRNSLFRVDYPSLLSDPNYFLKENYDKPTESSLFTEISHQVRKEFLESKNKIDRGNVNNKKVTSQDYLNLDKVSFFFFP